MNRIGDIKKLISLRERAKALYAQADVLESKLVKSIGVGKVVKLASGDTVCVVDNFRGTNKVFRAAAVKRFEISVK